MNTNQQRARGPTKAPMRGTGRPSRPPIGTRGGGQRNVPMQHQQQGYQQQPPVYNQRGRGSRGRGGVSRGGYPPPQRSYNQRGTYGGYQVDPRSAVQNGGQPQARHQPMQQQTMQQPMQQTMQQPLQTMQPMHNVQHVQQQQVNTQPMQRQQQPAAQRIQPMTNQAPAIPPMQHQQRQQVHSSMQHQRAPQQQQPPVRHQPMQQPPQHQQQQQPQVQVQQQQVVQPMQHQQQPVHNTMQQQRQPMQQQQPPQQQPPQQQQPARRPPMTTNNVTSFEHYSGAQPVSGVRTEVQPQQQQQQPPVQQPMMTQQHQQPMVNTTEPVQQVVEEKAPTQVTTGGPSGGPSPSQVKKPATPARRIPPWEAFTGRDKPHPTKYGWAQRVRQVMSADTVKLALFRDPNSKVDPLSPPDFIQVTLDGIDTPRCERYIPPGRVGQKGPDDDGKSPSSPSKSQGKEDDPFAYEAREFVRKKLMNKMVFYAIWRSDENSNRGANAMSRKWGDIYYKENNEMKSLTQELVIAGLAERAQRRTDLSMLEKETLDEKQAEAQKAGKGKWNEKKAEKAIRQMEWVKWTDHAKFGEKYLNKTLMGVVDGVISGSSLRVELCIDKNTMDFRNVVVNLAGVNAPRVPMPKSQMANDDRRRKNKSPIEEKLETFFGAKAKEWTEMRLLSQEVKVRVLFTTNQQIIAQVMCAQGRIGPSLVKKGLAKYEEWSATAADSQERKMLEEAHKYAVSHKLNIWQFAKESSRRDARQVTVTQVFSGDSLEVSDPAERGKKVRYTLSSIRAPRIGTRGGYRPRDESKEDRGQNGAKRGGRGGRGGGQNGRDEWSTKYGQPDQYLSREAKEFVRKMCIGKEVKLHYEYDRKMGPPNSKQQQKKRFATIFVQDDKGNEVNLALELMKRGLCELVLHGKNDTDRSMAYVELETASKKAIKDKTGVHKYTKWNEKQQMFVPDENARKKAAQQNKIMDYSGNDEGNVALHKLTSLNQSLLNRRVPGIVEFVFGANRVKIYMPKKNACIAVRLAGIRVGNYTSNRSEDPVSKRAKEYLNDTIVQREVEVFVTSASTGGPSGRGRRGRGRGSARGGSTGSRNPNLDGHILLNGVNIADHLLRNGLASLIVYRSGNQKMATDETANFKHLQDMAIAEKLGVWEQIDEDGGDDSKLEANYAARSKTGKTVEVVVSYASSATEFYVNDAGSKLLKEVGQKLEEMAKNPKIPQPKEIKKGKKVKFAALYDGYYARCRVSNPDNRARRDDVGGGRGGQRGGQGGGGNKVGSWFVDFIDYGNRASVSRNALAELPPELRVDRIPPLAMKCVLAGLRVDPDGPEFRQAGNYFSSYAFSEQGENKMKMKILYDDLYNKTWYVDLMVGDTSINQMLAFEGFVTQYGENDLPYSFKSKTEYEKPWTKEHIECVDQYFKDVRLNISAAKADHRHIFKYGDVEDDPDDNLGDR